MKKIYLEIVKSSYISGTSIRNKTTSLREVEVNDVDLDTIIETLESLEDEILIGMEYNNGMVGTDYKADQLHCIIVYIPIEGVEESYKRLIVSNRPYLGISLNYSLWRGKVWKLSDDNSKMIIKEIYT